MREAGEALAKVRDQRYDRIRAFDKSFYNFTNSEMAVYLDLYDKNTDDRFAPASATLVTAGCIMLFCNWLLFNGGSSFSVSESDNKPAEAIVATVVAGSAGCIGSVIFNPLASWLMKTDETNRFDLMTAGAGLLAGCVSITAGCATVSLLSASIIGILGCIIYLVGKMMWARL